MGVHPALLLPLILGCAREGQPVQSVSGTVSWTVDFDAAAEERGFSDCTYSRRYDGLTDLSAPWLCPECDAMFRADVSLKKAGCYAQISDEEASPTDWIGWGGNTFFRASTENLALSEQGTAKKQGSKRVVRHRADPAEIRGGGSFTLVVDGELEVGRGKGDPMWGYAPAEVPRCGWDRADPPPYEGDWRLRIGAELPDGWFHDACGEGVRLHDQLDRYLVIEVSALDCPPCQDMAAGEESFLDRAAGDGLDVSVVTLLAPALDAVVDLTPQEDLEEWTRVFGLSQPVLADRGWGFWLGIDAAGDGFGYPMIVLAAPDGTVIDAQVGFSGWDPIRRRIKEDAETR